MAQYKDAWPHTRRPFHFAVCGYAAGVSFMTNVIKNWSLLDTIKVGYKDVTAVGGVSPDLTKFLYSLPTLNISGSSANNYAVSVSFANGIQVINFAGGVRLATIQSSTLSAQVAAYTFANTSGTYPVSIQLDNGGLVGGVSVYPLNSGTIIQFSFNGTNLS
jgi:hypothetical protein